ncbi:M13 family metallopeptidase [Tautonia sociabilis]|uniref:Peptidase M13 n=1 Tax=Tautonia sociabilis TaxID=2080755 RepID=A0A432MNN8_9BACT|nr:M13 family metallopeptidase [Tautonia sociabilis]RUL88688.1 peptidase M13 [Tautonia sociabilis]
MSFLIRGALAASLLAFPALGLRAEPPADPETTSDSLRSGIDLSHADPSVRPQDDLFRHVNGSWLDTAEIPADRAVDGSFYTLRDEAEAHLRAIIERAASADAEPGSEAQKVGDLFASFMDEQRIEALGLDPIRDELAMVDAIGSKDDFIRALGELGRLGVDGLFGGYVDTDAKQSDRYALNLFQGGLGLPDESYYRDETFAKVRDAYVDHIARMFELAGIAEPRAKAEQVMELETTLSRHHWDRVRSRDATLTYNKKDLDALAELSPGFDWPRFFDSYGAGGVTEVIVAQPSYFEAMAGLLDEIPLDRWKTWLSWNVLSRFAPYLSAPFVAEDFSFYGTVLTGAEENRPRWKRGVQAVEVALGEAVGKLYVEEHFPPEAKARMRELVANLIEAYRQGISGLDWMGEETKRKALEKLATFNPKIGYPDSWRDYSALEIRPDDLVGNMQRATAFEVDRNLAKLGSPVDRGEWFMTPQTVNAYYNPGMNEIVFPAAILRPPFFNMEADDAVNYGAIGAVIGHEIGHGFDDQGSKYDGAGNMNNWWTDADREEFEARAEKLIEQYNGFSPAQLPDQHVNGALTIGENIGDLGGLTIAHRAYRLSLGGEEPPVIDGLTGDQRFFMGWAQVWRTKYRDAELSRRLATDPHSPAEFRCNGVLRNMPEFHEAFGVKEGDALYLPPEERVKIW